MRKLKIGDRVMLSEAGKGNHNIERSFLRLNKGASGVITHTQLWSSTRFGFDNNTRHGFMPEWLELARNEEVF